MKRSISLVVLAGWGLVACNPPTAPQTSTTPSCRFVSFDIPSTCDSGGGPPPSPQVALIDTVSAKVVRAGDNFAAVARAGFFCGGEGGEISVTYADHQDAQYFGGGSFGSLTDTLTAILGDTVVSFQASCPGAVTTQTVTIQVLPVQ